MGLDQYLRARVWVPRQEWPEHEPQSDAAADLIGSLTAGGMNVQQIPTPKGDPIANPRYPQVLDAIGFEPKDLTGILTENVGVYVEVQVGYWRKQNQIHGWMERHLAVGPDGLVNSVDYDLDRDTLEQLRDDCRAVLDTIRFAPESTLQNAGTPYEFEVRSIIGFDRDVMEERDLVPTSGFFFGGSEVDDWYVSGLEQTIEIVERVLAHPALADADFSYRGWW